MNRIFRKSMQAPSFQGGVVLTKWTASKSVVMAIGLLLSVGQAQAATIFASGQRLIPAVPGVHEDLRENFIYAIDSGTGIATSIPIA